MQSPRHPTGARLAALVAGALVLAACGGGDDTPDAATSDAAASDAATGDAIADEPVESTTPPTATAPAATTGATEGGAPVPAALDFSAPLVGGGEIEMGEYAGRPVLLWFWAPW